MDDVSRKYYCYIDEQEVGPLSFDEIIQLGITPDTPVWYEGVTDWRPASSFPEFKPAFNASEPPPAPLPLRDDEVQVAPRHQGRSLGGPVFDGGRWRNRFVRAG